MKPMKRKKLFNFKKAEKTNMLKILLTSLKNKIQSKTNLQKTWNKTDSKSSLMKTSKLTQRKSINLLLLNLGKQENENLKRTTLRNQ